MPMGFFYGPQIDAYIGYANYSYGLDTSTADDITSSTFSGLLLGAQGSIPIQKQFRLFLNFDFIFNPGYEEEVATFGEEDSTSNYHLEFGSTYSYSPNTKILGSFGITSSTAKFISPTQEVSLKDSELKLGAVFTF